MHLGAHLGAPVLGFFLSSAWLHETGPYGEGHHVWQTARACGPCLETAPCPYDVACGQPLAQVELLRSIAAVLGRVKAGASPVSVQAESWPPLPVDLQLWRTGLDALGTRPHLLAGSDPHARERSYVRDFLAARLHLPMPGDRSAPARKPRISTNGFITMRTGCCRQGDTADARRSSANSCGAAHVRRLSAHWPLLRRRARRPWAQRARF
ncbi:MAG: hypothetical protein QM665_10810 [Desulfovibrio sp.]